MFVRDSSLVFFCNVTAQPPAALYSNSRTPFHPYRNHRGGSQNAAMPPEVTRSGGDALTYAMPMDAVANAAAANGQRCDHFSGSYVFDVVL